MKFAKFMIGVILLFNLIILSYGYLDDNGVIDTIKSIYKKEPTTLVVNEYSKELSTNFVQLTDDFIADDKQELLNIYYTIISSGMNEFTFYCSNSYKECNEDITIINYDAETLSHINNFVNVYNTFESLKTDCSNNGKVTIYINRAYSNSEIDLLQTKVDEVYNNVVKSNLSNEENIKRIHDYLINNTVYDANKNDAVNLLYNGKANCNGYADAFSLLLDKLGIENIRISSSSHIWNLVNINDKWLHVDVTWDDPVNSSGTNMLQYNYFLKTTSELDKTTPSDNLSSHEFDKLIYYFAN